MDAGFKSQGSFGIPEHVRKQIEETHRPKVPSTKVEAVPAVEEESTPESPAAEPPKPSKEDEDQAAIKKSKKFWEGQLEIKLTAKDMTDYLFKGRLVKEGIFVASYPADDNYPPTYKDFRVTFQSHTPADLAEVDEHMAAFRDRGKYTAEGLENEKALRLMSHVLLKADGRSLGKDHEERYKNIIKLAGGLVALISKSWDGFNLLLSFTSQEKKTLKKVLDSPDLKVKLDLRLSGVNYESLTPFEVDVLGDRIREKEQLAYFQLLAIVSSIQAVAGAVINGEAKFTKTSEILKIIKDMVFPEFKQEVEHKAKRTKELIQKEMERGPMTVQRLDYGKKGKKRR